jgi:hypothetical protein
MARRPPPSDLQRRRATREPKRRFLIVCEGRTEQLYFRQLAIEVRHLLIEVEIEPEVGVPKTLVERAAKRKKEAERDARSHRDSFLRFDEVWCVFDVDAHPHLPDARQQAQANGIHLAVSNPCFELWALLHFQDQSAYLDRAAACHFLRRHLPGYDKVLAFERLRNSYDLAVERAANLDRRCESAGSPGDNPSTGVYRLTEQIRGS